MTPGTMYLRPVTTLAGNRGHELVLMVSREALAKARQAAEDARRRVSEARTYAESVRLRREADAARIARRDALFALAEEWMRDRDAGVRRG